MSAAFCEACGRDTCPRLWPCGCPRAAINIYICSRSSWKVSTDGASDARSSAAQTESRCASVNSAKSGRDRVSAAKASAAGKALGDSPIPQTSAGDGRGSDSACRRQCRPRPSPGARRRAAERARRRAAPRARGPRHALSVKAAVVSGRMGDARAGPILEMAQLHAQEPCRAWCGHISAPRPSRATGACASRNPDCAKAPRRLRRRRRDSCRRRS